MKPNPVETGKRIKSIRSNFGMTMEQFADLIGNAQKGNINNWERGFSLPNKERLIKIAELSNKTIDWIKWGTLEEYITSYLIDSGYELYIKDFPEITHKIFKDIKERYSDTFSLDKNYELLHPIIKNIFAKYYSKEFEDYLNEILANNINPLIEEYASQKHSISKEQFFKRANSKLQEKIRNGDFKYGEKETMIESSKQLLDEMDLAYKDFSEYSSVEDFFYKITKNQFETEKFISDLSKKYNFPYEKNSTTAKFLTNNHDKFKHN
ncbi:helix-turn-helix domain-containing protein [Enterococcus faecalis]|uniref:helix-turn-helix domain-containing protein n=1 Tax=Enterococcus cecorum TaxID=44008 RepID=UPI0019DCC74B|nr:helix-turn-helix transcriptional regulator [Enterococcus cecorum]EGO5116206.1 helix-turn-helix transcriptional regulator [Enterococcus faecalis]EGO6139587.1 helix-turn-helix transcriptional regulator [Enterococcus faecalis]EGO8944600.1 XRE family transcriptional regulator [Enterococcus faecalis]EGS8062921.1 helix-turn-helix transcriptional regulator [Enterococcus faecalis]EHB6461364.1 helix-turn-helix transcriptional regulator [Enterococcus faecalis]